MHTEFMAFINDEESAHIIRSWAEKQGFPTDTVRTGGADLFARLLESDPPPKLALVDFDKEEQPGQMAARLISLAGSGATMVGFGSENDVTLYRSLLAAGFSDYLVKPLTPEILTQTLIAASRGEVGPGAIKDAKNIIVIGIRGGVGASTVASNVAWLMAHELKKKVALLDLDLQFGTSALALDVEPGHGLKDVVSSPQRVDGLMIAGAIINESDDLAVLSAEESIDEGTVVDPNAITALLKEMRTNYQAILIDMPRHLISSQKRVLAAAHEIILVTEMSLVGIRDTLRVRTLLKSLGSSARITQVATKIGPERPSAVDEPTFAKGAQGGIDFVITDDHKNTCAASNAGKMLGSIAPNAPITKSLLGLASHLLGTDDNKDKKNEQSESLFKKLLGAGHKGKEPAKK